MDSTPDAVEQDVTPAPETMVESAPLPDVPQPQERPREEVKLERPPDEAPAEVPLPVEKPPEKVQNSPPPAPVTAQRCSKRFCGLLRNYGRSHQRQCEALDSSCVHKQSTGGEATKNGQISPRPPFGLPDALVTRPHLASVLQEGWKYSNIHARSGVNLGNPGSNGNRWLPKLYVAPSFRE
jgi:hypothetical protein